MARRPALLLHLADDVGRDGWVEVDGVVAQALGALVAFPAAAFKRLAHADLCAVAVLGVILDTVHVLRKKKKKKNFQQYSACNEEQGFQNNGHLFIFYYFCPVSEEN